MTRIIAGRLGGRRLATPRGDATRPTSERVREAVFSRIESLMDLTDARVLDLYAGSGALGLEAVSRGAGFAVLVDSDRRTARLVESNIADLDLGTVAVARAEKVDRLLERGPGGPPFDLVLLDPPYPLGEAELTGNLQRLTEHRWLTGEALVVIERSGRSPDPALPPGLVSVGSRRYGETTVHFVEPGERRVTPAD